MARREAEAVSQWPLKGCILSRKSQGGLSGSSPVRSDGSCDSQTGLPAMSPPKSFVLYMVLCPLCCPLFSPLSPLWPCVSSVALCTCYCPLSPLRPLFPLRPSVTSTLLCPLYIPLSPSLLPSLSCTAIYTLYILLSL